MPGISGIGTGHKFRQISHRKMAATSLAKRPLNSSEGQEGCSLERAYCDYVDSILWNVSGMLEGLVPGGCREAGQAEMGIIRVNIKPMMSSTLPKPHLYI